MYSVETLQALFLEHLIKNSLKNTPTTLYEPINYVMSLGGKRLRPVLLLMAHNLFDDKNVENALHAAMAVEVFHNFTLVHDDIMDCAPLRRGKPTAHTKYGINTGILSGDLMLILAYEHLSKCPNEHLPTLIKIFNRFAICVCEGQQYDMDFEQRNDVSIPEYINMIAMKTAALVEGSLEMGAILGGATADEAKKLASFGKNIGIAFQLQDDILDTFGEPEKFGKKVGGDIVQNKKTFLLIKAFELAKAETRTTLLNALAENDESKKITVVTNIFNQLNIRAIAETAMEHYLAEGLAMLDAIQCDENRKKPLRNVALQLMNREH